MNLFLVSTPHQILNATEAKFKFPSNENHLCVLANKYSIVSFELLINKEEWTSVEIVSSSKQSNDTFYDTITKGSLAEYRTLYSLRKKIDSLADKYKKTENVFIGNYQIDIIRHFINKIHYNRLIILDDGTGTLDICYHRKFASHKLQFSLSAIKKYIKNKTLRIDVKNADSVTFFTTYDLDVADGDMVVKNNYSHLRSLLNKKNYIDSVYFLGQPVVEAGEICELKFFKYFEKVLEYYQNKDVIYITHKREKVERINKIKKYYEIDVNTFNIPIEFKLTKDMIIPFDIASFFSSALENCRVIFSNKLNIVSFYLQPSDILRNHRFIESVYRDFEKKTNSHFKLINPRPYRKVYEDCNTQ